MREEDAFSNSKTMKGLQYNNDYFVHVNTSNLLDENYPISAPTAHLAAACFACFLLLPVPRAFSCPTAT